LDNVKSTNFKFVLTVVVEKALASIDVTAQKGVAPGEVLVPVPTYATLVTVVLVFGSEYEKVYELVATAAALAAALNAAVVRFASVYPC
jgi:hypothetical protein